MSHGLLCFCARCLTGTTSKKGGNRGHTNGKNVNRDRRKSKSFDSNKVHNTKGKNNHGRSSW